MKTLFAFILCCMFGFGAIAQQSATQQTTTTTAQTTTAKTSTAPAYRCPVCGAIYTKPGNCSKDKVALVKIGDYYCPECYMTSQKSGKCPMCGVALKQMTSAKWTTSTSK